MRIARQRRGGESTESDCPDVALVFTVQTAEIRGQQRDDAPTGIGE
jgi:hypothetical protein